MIIGRIQPKDIYAFLFLNFHQRGILKKIQDWTNYHHYLSLISLGFLKVLSLGREGISLTPLVLFIFHEELIQYQYNFMQLLNKLFKVGYR